MSEESKPSKRLQRLESKKRKLKAFLEVAESNDEDRKVRKLLKVKEQNPQDKVNEKTAESSEIKSLDKEELEVVKEKFRQRREKKKSMPMFYLTEEGRNAMFHASNLTENAELVHSHSPLLVQDLQNFLLLSLLGSANQKYLTRWCRLLRHQYISQVTVIVAHGLTSTDFSEYRNDFCNVRNTFLELLEFLPPENYGLTFISELSYLPLGVCAFQKLQNELQTEEKPIPAAARVKSAINYLFPVANAEPIAKEHEEGDEFYSRMDLLLSPMQMLIENYPLPSSNIANNSLIGYRYTKDVYMPVTEKSPMFAVDCEMCLTNIGKNELTKVAIIDEKLNTVYETFVKPKNHIVNYLTKYSGITKAMLAPVTTQLSDVHRHISTFLPSDAILVGQSLNCDLHALKLIHPYVIDTSVVYNITGERRKKSSLKVLSASFLNEEIQQGNDGHDPVEDSAACMKLILKKLENGPMYGDVILGGEAPKCPNSVEEGRDNSQFVTLGPQNKSRTGFALSFFQKLIEENIKTCIIGDCDMVDEYPVQTLAKGVTISKFSKDKFVKALCLDNAAGLYNLLICHINCTKPENSDRFKKLDEFVKSMFDASPDKSCVVLIGASASVNQQNCSFDPTQSFAGKFGVCGVQLKVLNEL